MLKWADYDGDLDYLSVLWDNLLNQYNNMFM